MKNTLTVTVIKFHLADSALSCVINSDAVLRPVKWQWPNFKLFHLSIETNLNSGETPACI